MIPNRLLVPIAYLAPLQCLGLIVLFRWLVPPENLWLVFANFLGLFLGLLLAVTEVAVIGEVFWGKRPKRTAQSLEQIGDSNLYDDDSKSDYDAQI